MQKQLHMNAKNNAYTIVSVVFFIPYMLFQPPATVAIREIGPRIFLTCIIFGWGAVMIVSLKDKLREDLASDGRPSSHSGDLGSRLLSWLCIFA